MNNIPVIDCQNVAKTYRDGSLNVDVLHDLNVQIQAGESVSIIGASGSGKSTLLHILGGLDTPTSGSISLMGHDLATLSQAKLGQLRNQYLGFVYQFHHLLAEFTALENVMMPLLIGKMSKAQAREQAATMLEKVGLGKRMEHRPTELSGGERQRAAIARALVNNPKCLLADEPTGNLDRKNAWVVLDMMLELQAELGTALVVVTHDDELATKFNRVLTVQEGSLVPFQAA
ncbi:lipoprotein-releasing ABC transporter ATP-binding protein LolD [Kingella negevensis]|uniref:Lipoprotein-releasing system ATP-binding protein LolD n=1 Tax=Kingella negevensis TaxID=1522312 RepID=A0A238HI74_9NEIS|nr:lipoprotein-releasing ABC transporter ATP-binding protein LolD [Kingella negevensis]MDK4684613.1 lipoprotein-releasing ABC transporter ATP-binding protein LolD [Kingella negevensis]MDK4696942.1 lipoprotein-releasing ABC transporter ATP-binding protein LolD [Kingella negevensis]MDK4708122.1 lipoprotein-releasing ABC transporter ATP-binding protein LolD [Kingella negevensis]MDK4709687.1 lipoprotein-releasing ABC transporter ATP-binding protein LolD [Kingella negevensis]SNB78080.1 Lipoprotein-